MTIVYVPEYGFFKTMTFTYLLLITLFAGRWVNVFIESSLQ